ncbi:hypothetical protein GO013_11285 [Pseudodesulfovibrio sp. JC047]|uniref:hypothetical protein n=1 Tax=Pseudodesulfovibrio sp. JC047 TaxID=2683199 RepID=UPI0013D44595|nr:hypothetical protein [Pseudodesulfovibrio sp. JC047]NDV20005.1 hypothetical protein [Pseudodesulfovibrio sp. JC047]
MTFTALETMSIAGLFSLVSAVFVRLLFSRSFVTRGQCSAEREKLCIEREQFGKDIQSIKSGQRTQFKMLRAIIVHSGIPAEKQEDILNED